MKLLGNRGPTLSLAQMLSCLCQRIPIEFLSARYASQISKEEKDQVHSHMRVILKICNSFETMVSTSPSEPVLSEAAYAVMTTRSDFSAPQALQQILDGFAVNKGEVGELLVALLFILSCDYTIGPADQFGHPPGGERCCSVTHLLTSLFCASVSTSEGHVDITASHGWRCQPGGISNQTLPLGDAFKNSKIYFHHFIKVHEHALFDKKHLMRLMARGAAMLCANGQPGVDGIIPFLLDGDKITPDNIGIIMFQVKNDARHSHIPKVDLFDAMDPQNLGLFSTDIPIIRIVFALAANQPQLVLVDHATPHEERRDHATYDFWVSGLSSDLLGPIAVGKQSTWASILQASHGWKDTYSDTSDLRTNLRMSMNPGTATDDPFWVNWCNAPSPKPPKGSHKAKGKGTKNT